jgi:adenine phosphoribosyltransferase
MSTDNVQGTLAKDASNPDAAARDELARRLVARIVDVPDYPQPGVMFKDITPLLADPETLAAAVDGLAIVGGADGVDRVVGMEARGFVLAAPVAYRAGKGFVPVRKVGKLPRATHAVSYALEYGTATLEVHTDAFTPGERVLIVDDVLATGGTVAATAELVRRCGAHPVGVAVLMELTFLGGRERLAAVEPDLEVSALIRV